MDATSKMTQTHARKKQRRRRPTCRFGMIPATSIFGRMPKVLAALMAMLWFAVSGSANSEWTSIHGNPQNSRRCVGEVYTPEWDLVWSRPFFGASSASLVSRGSAPLAKNGRVVFEETRNVFKCVNLLDGTELWSNTPPNAGSEELFPEGGCIIGDRVFQPRGKGNAGGPDPTTGLPNDIERIECLSLIDGSLLWTWTGTWWGTVGSAQAIPGAAFADGKDRVAAVVRDHYPALGAPSTRLLLLDAGSPTSSVLGAPDFNGPVSFVSTLAPAAFSPSTMSTYLHVVNEPATTSIALEIFDIGAVPSPVGTLPLSASIGPVNVTPDCHVVITPDGAKAFVVDAAGWLFGFDVSSRTLLWAPQRV
ncbi:MAG: hypothetical protein ABL982_08290, partial [Vicinamibacterales bacterium]